MKALKLNTAVVFALALLVIAASGQTPDKDEPIKINTVLLNIPVIVSDAKGRYVSGLKKENFSIMQDGEKQDIEFFADELKNQYVIGFYPQIISEEKAHNIGLKVDPCDIVPRSKRSIKLKTPGN